MTVDLILRFSFHRTYVGPRDSSVQNFFDGMRSVWAFILSGCRSMGLNKRTQNAKTRPTQEARDTTNRNRLLLTSRFEKRQSKDYRTFSLSDLHNDVSFCSVRALFMVRMNSATNSQNDLLKTELSNFWIPSRNLRATCSPNECELILLRKFYGATHGLEVINTAIIQLTLVLIHYPAKS